MSVEQPQNRSEGDPFIDAFATLHEFEQALLERTGVAIERWEHFKGNGLDIVVAPGSDRNFYLVNSADGSNIFITTVLTWVEAKALAESMLGS